MFVDAIVVNDACLMPCLQGMSLPLLLLLLANA